VTLSQKIGKPNNFKAFVRKKTKVSNANNLTAKENKNEVI
jgi:hypothetical protein